MKTSDKLLIAAAVAVVGYLVWKHYSKGWSDSTGSQAMTSAGFTPGVSSMNPGATTYNGGDTTFLFRAGDFGKLNLAQRTLITLDKVVPGTFLSRWALT